MFVKHISLSAFRPQKYSFRPTKEMISMNDNWAEPFYQIPDKSFVIVEPEKLHPPVKMDCRNEFNLSEEDTAHYAGKIDPMVVTQFLRRTEVDVENGKFLDLLPISNFMKCSLEDDTFFKFPKPLISMNVEYLSVRLEEISFENIITNESDEMIKNIPLTEFRGMLYLFDESKQRVQSEPVYFSFKNGNFQCQQTKGKGIYFEVCEKTPSLRLMIILMHSNANQSEQFIQELCKNGTSPDNLKEDAFPFAFSYLYPFDEKRNNKEFKRPWFLFKHMNSLLKLNPDTSKGNTISLKGSVKSTLVKYEDLPQLCISSNEPERNLPFLALSVPQRAFFPTSTLTLSSLYFILNETTRNIESVFFKMFICNDGLGDPLNPNGIPSFISRGNESISNSYESIHMRIDKKIAFPDIIQLHLNKPSQKANIIIHVYFAQSRGEPQLQYITAFNLFNEDSQIINLNCSFKLFKLKKFKYADCLAKNKSGKRTMVSFNVDIPYHFYPDDSLKQFFKDYQVESIKQECFSANVIPIFYKLYQNINSQNIPDFLNFLKDETHQEQIKSWLFYYYNGSEKLFFNFCQSLSKYITQEVENNNYKGLNQLFKVCNIIFDIFLVEFHRTQFIDIKIFYQFSELIPFFIKKDKDINLTLDFNYSFGKFLYLMFDFDFKSIIIEIIRYHIYNLLKDDSYLFIWKFLKPFTVSKNIMLYLSEILPVRPLTKVLYSPFTSITSLLFLAFKKTIYSNSTETISYACGFFCKLFLQVENLESSTLFRIGYLFAPLMDIIWQTFESTKNSKEVFTNSQKIDLLAIIGFLISYSPQQYLRNYFNSMFPVFQSHFFQFFENALKFNQSLLEENSIITIYHGLFEQITKRIIQFLNLIIHYLADSYPAVIKLLSFMTSSKFQNPKNFIFLFDVVYRIIKYYPYKESLLTNLITIITSKQHITRCFATSLILLLFKTDFSQNNTILNSSVGFLNAITLCLLNSKNISDIKMYITMNNTIHKVSTFFNDQTFTEKIEERINIVMISEFIEKLKFSKMDLEERCLSSLQIADQYLTLPTMRIKWLKEIIKIHTKESKIKHYESAFIAQVRICLIILTVIEHLCSTNEKCDLKRQYNLTITQPMSVCEYLSERKKYPISIDDFKFIPSVLSEAQIDFSSISEDFKYVSSDFTIDYLIQEMSKAIEFGKKAKLFYSIRVLISLQIRLFKNSNQYKQISDNFAILKGIYSELNALNTQTYSNPLSFLFVNNRIYSIDSEYESTFIRKQKKKCIKVFQYESETYGLEHKHCFDTFRTYPSLEDLNVPDCKSKCISIAQFKTDKELPNMINYSHIISSQSVMISLNEFVHLNIDKLNRLMIQTAIQFERYFPCKNISKTQNDIKINITKDVERIISLFNAFFNDNMSIVYLLKLVENKGDLEFAQNEALLIWDSIIRLAQVYQMVIKNGFVDKNVQTFKESITNFQKEYDLPSFNIDGFKLREDPLYKKFY